MISKEKEYETKVLINKKVFNRLLIHYNLSLLDNTLIKNSYFDTTDLDIFNISAVFRIREKNNQNIITFKRALKQYELIELNQKINFEQFTNIKKNGFVRSKYKQILENNGIDVNKIGCLGVLITHRWKLKYNNSTIFIDHSLYNSREDYEIECEANNAKIAKKEIIKFCKENDVNFSQWSWSKYARFLKSRSGEM